MDSIWKEVRRRGGVEGKEKFKDGRLGISNFNHRAPCPESNAEAETKTKGAIWHWLRDTELTARWIISASELA